MKSPRTIIVKAFKDIELAYRRLWDDVYNIFNGDVNITGDLTVSGDTSLTGDLIVSGDTELEGPLLLAPGEAAVGKYPIKFQAGVALTTPETGAIEFHDDRFYITNKAVRKAVDRTSDVKPATTTVVSTALEIEVFSASVPAGSWVAGNILKMYMAGNITNKASSQDVTVNVKVGGNTVATISSVGGKLTDACWEIKGICTVRTVGASGEMAWHMDMSIEDCNCDASCGVSAINTTGALDITVTAQWDTADAGNIFACTMGFMEYKN